jgi:hypothetical protein
MPLLTTTLFILGSEGYPTMLSYIFHIGSPTLSPLGVDEVSHLLSTICSISITPYKLIIATYVEWGCLPMYHMVHQVSYHLFNVSNLVTTPCIMGSRAGASMLSYLVTTCTLGSCHRLHSWLVTCY